MASSNLIFGYTSHSFLYRAEYGLKERSGCTGIRQQATGT